MDDKKTPFSQVHIQLSAEHLGLVEKAQAKVGGRVRLVIYGSLKGMSKAQTDRSEEGGNVGSLEVDASSIKFASNNEIAELFEDDLDG